jgi:hypothetical protein
VNVDFISGMLHLFLQGRTDTVRPEGVYALINENIIAPLAPLLNDSDVQHHAIIGPGGIGRVTPVLALAFQAMAQLKSDQSADLIKIAKMSNALHLLSNALLKCMRVFRATYDRSRYDPIGGFSQLAEVLRLRRADLPVCYCLGNLSCDN